MALVSVANNTGIIVRPFGMYPSVTPYISTAANAVGESTSFVGQMLLSSGPGTSKTISSVGGKIWFIPAAVTWAAAGTTLRVGIQDVGATGIDDGTYDVYDDLVQGTDALPANAIKEVTMSSGTKTIAHGDVVSVVIEMTVRNGTDSVSINRINMTQAAPYILTDTGTGSVKSSSPTAPYCAIQFDDGTIGWFGDTWSIPMTEIYPASFGSSASPDEYALIFQVPFKCAINAVGLRLASVTSGEDAVMALISDPLGSSADIITAVLDADYMNAPAADSYGLFEMTETILSINTTYALSYRPTTTGIRNIALMNLPHADFRKAFVFGTTMQGASRTDLGAFTASDTVIPDFVFRISKLDDGIGSGGTSSHAYIG